MSAGSGPTGLPAARAPRWSVLALCVVALIAGCVTPDGPARIDGGAVRRHIQVLSSDEFEGRRPTTRGERRTVEYIEREFRRLGLQPAFDGRYTQSVGLVERSLVGNPECIARAAGGMELIFELGRDFVLSSRRDDAAVRLDDLPLVFVGHGIVDPAQGWNDYRGLDVRGKVVVVLVNDPGFRTGDPALFRGRAMTYAGRWTYKFEEAARQGAAGALIVHETAAAAYPWDVVRSSGTGPQLDIAPAAGTPLLQFQGWLSHDAAARLLDLDGQRLDELGARAAQRGFAPIELAARLSVRYQQLSRATRSANVGAVLHGRERPGECVVVGAHWDHLGRDAFGGQDPVYNGAVDNATGVAGMLAIAAALADGSARRRSVYLLGWTAEESGLLGSEYYAAEPACPLARTAAVVNLDALYPMGRAHDVAVIGSGASDLEDELALAAARQGRRLSPDPHPEAGSYYRSDHFPLARAGVPALYVKSGSDLLAGGSVAAEAWQQAFVAQRYHRPADEYRDDWNIDGLLADFALLRDVVAAVANDTRWPQWKPGNEFAPERARSDAERR